MSEGIVILVELACGFAGYAIGRSKGRPGLGAGLGVLLGIIGLVIIALIPARRPQMVGPMATPMASFPPAGPPALPAAQWAPDPTGRNQLRWWDGRGWTDNVSNQGVTSVDALGPTPPAAPYG